MRSLRITLVALAAGTSVGFAQAPRQIRLKPATAELNEEFTAIGSVRELPDGRVLINDPRETRVVVADLKAGTVQQIGRKGQGPNEYGAAANLLALGGDSTLMVDGSTHRWVLFSGAAIAVTLPPDAPILKAAKTFARGADARGNVWSLQSSSFLANLDPQHMRTGTTTTGPSDSDYVVRANRVTFKVDTVASLRSAVSRVSVTADAQGKLANVSVMRPPLAVGEEAVLFADGWFAVARLNPYRVDWISPEAKVSKGQPLPVTPIKSTKAEKDAYFERQQAAQAAGRSGGGGARPPDLQRQLDALRDLFPDEFPPFTNGLIAGGDGNLYLRHPISMDYLDYRYDIVDRRGKLIGVLAMGKNERLVAVTKTAVYVVWKDADDIERLRRHPPIPGG